MNTATFISSRTSPTKAYQAFFKLDVPLDGHEFVVASAIDYAFDRGMPETLIFPADKDGYITSWGELPGSIYDSADVNAAMESAGYVVVRSDK